MKRFPRMAVVSLALALLVGCSAGSSTGDSGGADSGAGEGVSGPGDSGGAPGVPTEADPDRQVVTTASASLSVEDPAEAAQRVSELAESVGGRVDQRNEQSGSGKDGIEGSFADLVLRVPADALTGLLADLEDLGDV